MCLPSKTDRLYFLFILETKSGLKTVRRKTLDEPSSSSPSLLHRHNASLPFENVLQSTICYSSILNTSLCKAYVANVGFPHLTNLCVGGDRGAAVSAFYQALILLIFLPLFVRQINQWGCSFVLWSQQVCLENVSLPISAMFRFMVTRVSPGIFKRKNCRSKSTKLSEISLIFVVSSNRCSVRQPGTLSLIYWPWIMQMCTPHTPSSPSANGTRANIYSESAPSSIFPSFFISLLLFSPSEVHSHIKSAITGGQITGNFLWVRLAKRSQDPIASCSPMCLCIYLPLRLCCVCS